MKGRSTSTLFDRLRCSATQWDNKESLPWSLRSTSVDNWENSGFVRRNRRICSSTEIFRLWREEKPILFDYCSSPFPKCINVRSAKEGVMLYSRLLMWKKTDCELARGHTCRYDAPVAMCDHRFFDAMRLYWQKEESRSLYSTTKSWFSYTYDCRSNLKGRGSRKHRLLRLEWKNLRAWSGRSLRWIDDSFDEHRSLEQQGSVSRDRSCDHPLRVRTRIFYFWR